MKDKCESGTFFSAELKGRGKNCKYRLQYKAVGGWGGAPSSGLGRKRSSREPPLVGPWVELSSEAQECPVSGVPSAGLPRSILWRWSPAPGQAYPIFPSRQPCDVSPFPAGLCGGDQEGWRKKSLPPLPTVTLGRELNLSGSQVLYVKWRSRQFLTLRHVRMKWICRCKALRIVCECST